MSNKTIIVAKEFSRTPGPRYRRQGPFSGELFRKSILLPALKANNIVIVNLDGTEGYGSSFLDEAFGGLVFAEGLSARDVLKKLQIISDEDSIYKDEVFDSLNRLLR